MKKTLLTVLGCILYVFACAANVIDPKYGFGAVPADENGRVYFSESFDIPDGMTDDQCYDMIMNWAKGRFALPYAYVGRILNESPETHRFVFHVEQNIVFKSKALVVDESRITYNFTAAVSGGTVTLKIADIKYRYEENREGGGIAVSAEEWITDNECYNRKKTKFLRSTGKFRIKTIDLKDILFKNVRELICE